MNLLKTNVKPLYLFLFCFLLLVIVGVIDYYSGAEISPLLLYLVPIFFIGLHINSTKNIIFLSTSIATLFWIYAEYNTKVYSSVIILFWNAFVRFTIFSLFGFLLFLLRERYSKLNEINIKLQYLNVEKNKFIGIAAHDLKNPIGSINSFTDLLLEDYATDFNDEVIEILGYIKTLSSNSFHIIESLLDVSKIESGIVEINKVDQNYILFIKKLITINQLIANKKNIKIILKSDVKELNFKFDENHLSEVVNNLLTNAIKFSNDDKEIIVSIEKQDDKIKTSIQDNGQGIPYNEYDKLFKYFQKTSTTPTNGEQSTGLGLAITKKIIIEHGGEIGFISQLGEGSTFYYNLYF